MTNLRTGGRLAPRRRTTKWVGAALGLVTLGAGLAPAAAASAVGAVPKAAVVVQVVDRAPVGNMLATVGGASLYTSSAPCTGTCLAVWPPLVMPKGTSVPRGAKGLGTVNRTIRGHVVHQVTYHGKALFTFTGDSGTSLNGNGVAGFAAATVG